VSKDAYVNVCISACIYMSSFYSVPNCEGVIVMVEYIVAFLVLLAFIFLLPSP